MQHQEGKNKFQNGHEQVTENTENHKHRLRARSALVKVFKQRRSMNTSLSALLPLVPPTSFSFKFSWFGSSGLGIRDLLLLLLLRERWERGSSSESERGWMRKW